MPGHAPLCSSRLAAACVFPPLSLRAVFVCVSASLAQLYAVRPASWLVVEAVSSSMIHPC